MHLSDIFQRQHHHFMFRGALATFGCGIGAFLGDLIHGQKGIDARIELSTTGAAIEWASALGSTFLPRDIAGFDESSEERRVGNGCVSRCRSRWSPCNETKNNNQ